MKISVLNIKDMTEPGTALSGILRAYASIKIGPLSLHQVRLNKQPGGKWSVSPPQREYMSAANRLILSPLAEWPAEWEGPILQAVKQAFMDKTSLFSLEEDKNNNHGG